MGNKPKIFPGKCEILNEGYEANVELKFIRQCFFVLFFFHYEVGNKPKIFSG